VRHVFVKKFMRTTHIMSFSKILYFAPMLESRKVGHVKVIVPESCFCEKIQADYTHL